MISPSEGDSNGFPAEDPMALVAAHSTSPLLHSGFQLAGRSPCPLTDLLYGVHCDSSQPEQVGPPAGAAIITTDHFHARATKESAHDLFRATESPRRAAAIRT
jgi:hypothetical protein